MLCLPCCWCCSSNNFYHTIIAGWDLWEGGSDLESSTRDTYLLCALVSPPEEDEEVAGLGGGLGHTVTLMKGGGMYDMELLSRGGPSKLCWYWVRGKCPHTLAWTSQWTQAAPCDLGWWDWQTQPFPDSAATRAVISQDTQHSVKESSFLQWAPDVHYLPAIIHPWSHPHPLVLMISGNCSKVVSCLSSQGKLEKLAEWTTALTPRGRLKDIANTTPSLQTFLESPTLSF